MPPKTLNLLVLSAIRCELRKVGALFAELFVETVPSDRMGCGSLIVNDGIGIVSMKLKISNISGIATQT